MKKLKKILLAILLVLLISTLSIGIFAGNLVYNLVISSNSAKTNIYAANISKGSFYNENWLIKNSNYKDKYITSFDNLKLHSYVVKQNKKTSKWAIVVHGFAEEGKLTSRKALHFYEMGYNVLVPDLRGCGKSEGNYTSMGCEDKSDIIYWINDIIKNDKDSQIVLYGTSLGGATILMTSGEKLPANVKSIVSDCAFTSVYDIFDYETNRYADISSFPLLDFTNIITMIRAGYSLKDASAIDAVKKSTTPILYIHGKRDTFVPISMMNELYNSTTCEKKKLIIANGTHACSDLAQPGFYWSNVEKFLNQYVTK